MILRAIILCPTDRDLDVTLGAVLDALSRELVVQIKPMFRMRLLMTYVVSTLRISSGRIDSGRPVQSPGPVGRQIQKAFAALVKSEAD